MTSFRLFWVVTVLVCATGLTGCLTVFSKTEVIRSEEPRPAVQFESPKAASVFYEELDRRSRSVGEAFFGIPFITLYKKDTVLSDNAFFGDQVRECDSNHDGLITELEARIYARKNGGRIEETTSVKIVSAPAAAPAVVTTASHVSETEPARPATENNSPPQR
jgi:hypothetical protein